MTESPWPKIEEGVRMLRGIEYEDGFACKTPNPSLDSVATGVVRRWLLHQGNQEGPESWDFPGGPVVKTPHSQCRGPGFDPWSGN